MKIARFVLKIVALSLGVAALVCAVIAYWDKISDCADSVKNRLVEKRCCRRPSEYDDYADWDE
ncbi:hypothetical protein SDC9_92303 [bioreactor metagenome]|uniref:Uncharacterized protein n=1 Tax=bioreactor metagenome TaxID=1076179 RepID=A0A644ZXG2_9ZZZZ